MATTPASRFVWHELETTDPSAGIGFYKKVVGWAEQGWDKDPSYRMLAAGANGVAGVMALSQDALAMGATPMWLGYVSVASVDESVRKAEGLGARTLVRPEDIPDVGRFAVLADPQGVVFAVFTPLPMGGGGPAEQPGLLDFSWHELATTDWEAAWRFYRAIFGWEEESRMDMGAMGTYFMFKPAGGRRAIGAMMTMSPEMKAMFEPDWLVYVRVKDVDAAAERVEQHGGIVGMGPIDIPGGDRIVVCADPQGARFALHALAADLGKSAAKPAAKKAARKVAKKKTAKRPARKTARKAVKKRK